MAAHRSRDPRKRVYVHARIIAGQAWSDVTIQNVSRRGFMAYAKEPPSRGSYIELRKAGQVIVGRVVWAAGGAFGVRAQDDIDVPRLTGQTSGPPYRGPERRKAPRRLPNASLRRSPDVAFEQSRQVASRVNFAVLGLTGLGAAALLVSGMHATLAQPVAKVRAVLVKHPKEP